MLKLNPKRQPQYKLGGLNLEPSLSWENSLRKLGYQPQPVRPLLDCKQSFGLAKSLFSQCLLRESKLPCRYHETYGVRKTVMSLIYMQTVPDPLHEVYIRKRLMNDAKSTT